MSSVQWFLRGLFLVENSCYYSTWTINIIRSSCFIDCEIKLSPTIHLYTNPVSNRFMARFERSRERKRDSRGSTPRKGGRSRQSFKDGPKGNDRRSSGREFKHNSRDRRDIEMTKVTCSECKKECEVPFKPTSNKPVYCSDCFKNKGSSNKPSNRDFDIINEKLDKIMKALKIE